MTELSIHIPSEIVLDAESVLSEHQIPVIPADRLKGIIHPSRLPPSIPTTEQIETDIVVAIATHENASNPHPHAQYINAVELATSIAQSQPLISASNAASVRSSLEFSSYPEFEQSSKPTTRRDGSGLVVGDRWWDTGENISWFWNGTYWLSVFRLRSESSFGFVNGTVTLGNLDPVIGGNNIFLLGFAAVLRRGSPYNTTDYWTADVRRYNSSDTASIISSLTFNDTLTSGGDAIRKSNALNLHIDIAATGAIGFRAQLTKFAAAGNVNAATLTTLYRLAKI